MWAALNSTFLTQMTDAAQISSRDGAIESIVERSAAVEAMPTQDHNTLYVALMEELRTELDAEPEDEE